MNGSKIRTRGKLLVRALGLSVVLALTLGIQAASADLLIPLAPQMDNACNGAFQGTPPGSLKKQAFIGGVNGTELLDGAAVEPGDVIVFKFTWNTADWQGDTLDKLADCFTLNGEAYDSLDKEYKPTANDGLQTYTIAIPDLKAGDVLCDRARLSGQPAGDNVSTQKSNKLCLVIGETPAEQEPGRISVEKQTLPDGSVEKFVFVGHIAAQLGDGEVSAINVPAGTYHVSEELFEGWKLVSIVCNDADSFGNIDNRTATFKVDPGEAVHCVFTNEVESEGDGGNNPEDPGNPGDDGGNEPEVKGVKHLPKTGASTLILFAAALAFLAGGAVLKVAGRRQAEEI